MRNIRILLTGLFTLLISITGYPHEAKRATIRGTVTDIANEQLSYATIYLKGTTNGTSSDLNGGFSLNAPHGKHVLVVQMIGYEVIEVPVELRPGESKEVNLQLNEEHFALEEVVVSAKSEVRKVNETAYNVVAVDAKALHNKALELSHALGRVSGVKIKEVGGVGSDTQVTLNGFSGKRIKIFMDGIPIDGSGSSLGINNIPINLAERIEVYKGVVPVELGADALGGAINIVTKNTTNSYVDASYSIGSFNTHKSNLSIGHTDKKGYIYQLNVYQNYSDNSYKVKTNLMDLSTNSYSSEEHWFRRFHDKYHNEAIIAKFGVKDKRWASRFMVEATVSQEYAQIQNANLMKIVYGGKERYAKSIVPAVSYRKRNFLVENLNLSVTGRFNNVVATNTDTLARQYNWNGDWREKSSKGEGVYALSENRNQNGYITTNLNYSFFNKHYISLNNVFNSFSRKLSDEVANAETTTEGTFMKRRSDKNTFGLSYKFQPNEKWNLSGFAKQYNAWVTGPVEISTGASSVFEQQSKEYGTMGYGLASTYQLFSDVQLKLSFERACRLPSVNELFGDQLLESGDASLKAENSDNVNLNISYDGSFSNVHGFSLDVGLIYRDTKDYIRRQIEQRYGGAYYTNHGRVQNIGVDLEAHYHYTNKLSVGGNFTWQQMTNQERFSVTGQELIYYKGRMPNVPYLFSNFDASYSVHNFINKQNVLSFGYGFQFVNSFFRNWESEGGDIIIPTQFAHDFSVNLLMKNGLFAVTLEGKNLTNQLLYDNYSLQKPGRSFHLKLRYFFQQTRV